MRRRKILGVCLLVVASVLVVGGFAVVRNGDLNDADHQSNSCPRGFPRFQVTQEDAMETLSSTLNPPATTNWRIVLVVFSDRPSFDENSTDGLPPVNQVYVDTVASIPGVRARFVDELQNALSANVSADAISQVAALPFVSRIEQIPYGGGWILHLEKEVKYCSADDSWWSSQDGREWEEVPENKIPELVRRYAVQSGESKAFFSIIASHHQGLMTVDEYWVDGVSSQFVAKVNIAI